MFTLSELVCLNERHSSFKLLKPWWEVFMDYLVILMLMVSILAGTVLLSRDRVICLPVDPITASTSCNQSSYPTGGVPLPRNTGKASNQVQHRSRPNSGVGEGRRTHLVYQQYIYISQVCYHEALPWYSRFSPYMALLQTLVLLACGSFWFHFPLTSARIEHFLTILGKCCESPWTSRALSRAAMQEDIAARNEETLRHPPRPAQPSPPGSHFTQPSADSDADSPLRKKEQISVPPSPCLSTHSWDSAVSTAPLLLRAAAPSTPAPLLENTSGARRAVSLDRSDGEQARALFERVRRFRSHCESSGVIYKVYLAQTVFKVFIVTVIMSYSIPLLDSITLMHTCHSEDQALLGYSTFECAHTLASLLHKMVVVYLTLVGLYGLLNLYTLGWILRSSLRQYSFNDLKGLCSIRDVPDLRNDLAFLLHMADQYDPLLAQRLSVFLSPVSETRLLEENLEQSWGVEKLRSMVAVDADGQSKLQLVALPRLPLALYSLSHLQVMKLELITDAKFTAQLANMASLRELHLYHCSAAVDPAALGVLQERLEALHLTFTQATEIPAWVYSLRGLHELHLSGGLGCDGSSSGGHGWALRSLRQLRRLRVLVLRGTLQRVPGELCEVAGSLARLEIHNGGSRLLALTGLRRVAGLTELHLQGCQLERLPSALLALSNLRTLDLQNNSLRTLEELLSLAHLRRLSCLRLAYNRVLALPASVAALRALELLDLANNHLQSLPPALFTLHRLRRLLLAGNLLERLPAEIRALQLLTELDVSSNRLESLPPELFSCCTELRILNISHNSLGSLPPELGALRQLFRLDVRSNNLENLPAELAYCSGLRGGGLLVEDVLLRSLPHHVREGLTLIGSPTGKSAELDSWTESDYFTYLSPAQWSFSSAVESRI